MLLSPRRRTSRKSWSPLLKSFLIGSPCCTCHQQEFRRTNSLSIWEWHNPVPKPRPQLLQRSKLRVIYGTRKFISKSCGLGGRSRENTLTIHIFNKYYLLIERSCDITLGNFSQVLNSGYVLTEVPDKSCANTKTISNKCHKINLSGLFGNFLFYVIPTISYLWA